jgi:hypothetical protein
MARALEELRHLQADERRVFRSSDLSDASRTILTDQGFLRPVTRGWLMAAEPRGGPGDSTPWYASFWQFCAAYCAERFGQEWHLSPEQSLLFHAENTVVPRQVVVFSPKAQNNNLPLPFGTALFDSAERTPPPVEDLTERGGLRLYSLGASLVRVPESFYAGRAVDAEVALGAVRTAAEVLGPLLDGGHTVVAGRLAGAFRHVGRTDVAEQILVTCKRADMEVRETNPFVQPPRERGALRGHASPIVGRISALWEGGRGHVISAFPRAPGLPSDTSAYMQAVADVYQFDAYHSLSIEGYRVTPELIERVRSGEWNPDFHEGDRERENALAARGYYLAFERAKDIVRRIIAGADAGQMMRRAHMDWYQDLFQPKVQAGILAARSLAGYRNHFIHLRTSRYVPPHKDLLPEAMSTLLDLLCNEPEPCVRATLGHWLFGYVHPFPDGNGRTARLLMNAMLASGGYPWTVIRTEDRDEYLHALDDASIRGNIAPFTDFLATRVRHSIDQQDRLVARPGI